MRSIVLECLTCILPAGVCVVLIGLVAVAPLVLCTSFIGFLSGQATHPTDSEHSKLGDPVRIEQTIDRAGYRGLYSKTHSSPLWVSYRATKVSVTGPLPRPANFRTDMNLPATWRIFPRDFNGTMLDRGHCKPADDAEDTPENAADSFLMSNIIPQSPDLNRVCWRRLESAVRAIVKESDEAIIVTGPIFQSVHCVIGEDGRIVVPGGSYKVAAVRRGAVWRVYSFTAMQGFRDQTPDQLRVPLRTVEQLIGFEMFPSLKLSSEDKAAVAELP